RVGLKILAGVSIGVAIAGAAYWKFQIGNVMADYEAHYRDNPVAGVDYPGGGNCRTKIVGDDAGHSLREDACNAPFEQWFVGPITVAAAAVGVGTLIYLVVSDSGDGESSTKTAGLRKKKKPAIAITPIVSPTAGGATFRIDF